jgi:hypothetical protein
MKCYDHPFLLNVFGKKIKIIILNPGSGDIRDLNRNSENWAVVKAALTAGAYPNLARYDREGRQLRSQ